MTIIPRNVRRLVAPLTGLLLTGAAALAQEGEQAEAPESWSRCNERVAQLAEVRATLQDRARSLGVMRHQAAADGDRSGELALLSRGEAVADSIRAVSTALLAQELICSQVAQRRLVQVERELDQLSTVETSETVQRDSLLRLQSTLGMEAEHSVRAEFALPVAGEADPPGILRQKSAFARDLVDRAERWLGIIAREQEAIEHRRLARETQRLLEDEAFFDDRATLEVSPSGPLGEPVGGSRAGLFPGLIDQLPGLSEHPTNPEELLELIRTWLVAKREELRQSAEELEREALRREIEP